MRSTKEVKHASAVRRAGWEFFALVWEAHGFASPGVEAFLAALASHRFGPRSPASDALRAATLRSWHRRLATMLQLGNALCVLGRIACDASGLPLLQVPGDSRHESDGSAPSAPGSAGGDSRDEEYEFLSDTSSHFTVPVGSSTQGSGAPPSVAAGGLGSGLGWGTGRGLGVDPGLGLGLGLGTGTGVGTGLGPDAGMGAGLGAPGRGLSERRSRGRSAPRPWRPAGAR